MLHIVDRPAVAPGHCIVSMKDQDPEGFIDTMLTPALVDPRVYLSVSVVKEYARELGMVDGGLLEQAEREIGHLREQLADADGELSAINFIKGRGYQPVKRAGRPPVAKA